MSQAHLRNPILLSILAALATFALKFAAYALTGSVGLLSDALESFVNLAAALTALASLWYAARPVDPSHTYGHEKIEFFSSGLEGLLILLAAVGIGWYAGERLFTQRDLEPPGIGLLLALAAAFINLAVARILLRVGRQCGSIVLEADGHHLMSDVWISFAVVAGVALAGLTGWTLLDPLIGLVVAVGVVWTGMRLILRSFNGLMDHALSEAEQAAVRTAIQSLLTPDLHFHALRTRQAGTRRFVDFHLLVPGRWTVQKAHDLTECIECAVRGALPGAEITVHIEPIEAQESWTDSALLQVEGEQSGIHSPAAQPPPKPPL
jgi:cation diffusion facilitator family transporter